MPGIAVARSIVVVKLPEASQDLLRNDKLAESLHPSLFADEAAAMGEVGAFVEQLSDTQAELLLGGLQHAIHEDHQHGAVVQFLELDSEYELEGVGLEIRDDSVAEEKMFGPVRVMFVNWHATAG